MLLRVVSYLRLYSKVVLRGIENIFLHSVKLQKLSDDIDLNISHYYLIK